MRVPWGTFRKWLLPNDSNDYREMPDMARVLIEFIVNCDKLEKLKLQED